MMANEFPQVMTIGGTDSDGSAGVQADLHSFFMRGVYGATVLTAAVAGNSYGIQDSMVMPLPFIDAQFKSLAADLKIKAAKTGMLADKALVQAIIKNWQQYDFGALVVDPVIITKHGAMLLEQDAYDAVKNELIPLATVVTPNHYEAEHLTGMKLDTDADTEAAAHQLQASGAKNVVLKGAHDDPTQKEVRDFVLLESVNGTGDTLSAVITAEIGKGNDVEDAIRIAKRFTNQAIGHPIPVGHKYGPINHWANQIVYPQQ